MGCDIHLYVEVRKDGKWEYHDWTSQFYTGEKYESGEPKMDYDRMWSHPFSVNRNYSLFAILANVRNGRGFAGVKTGEGFNPIADPRGIPEDTTEEVLKDFCYDYPPEKRDQADSWVAKGYSEEMGNGRISNPDWHSASWFTLKELQDYDWNQVTTQQGVVGVKDYLEFKKEGRPSFYCGAVFGGNIKHITNEEMDAHIAAGTDKDFDYRTTVKWDESYKDCCDTFLTLTMPSLATLGKPEDVRIVFWFDN